MKDFTIKIENVKHLKRILKLIESLGIRWGGGEKATDMNAINFAKDIEYVRYIEYEDGYIWWNDGCSPDRLPRITIKDLENDVIKEYNNGIK